MNPNRAESSLAPLRFFGQVTATFSHEFRNALAIIKENTGLLQDLAALAERGRPLSPERCATLAERIGRQIARADDLTGQLNQFAHSVDAPEARVDVAAALHLVAALAARPAALRSVTLEVRSPPEPLQVNAFPFALQRLLFRCVESLLAAAGSGGRLIIEAGATAQEIEVRLTARPAETPPPVEAAAGDPEEIGPLASELSIALDHRRESGYCRLRWPRRRIAGGA